MSKLFVVPSPKELRAKKYATTIYLSHAQRVAISELILRRMTRRRKKPTMKAILVEGLELLFRKEKIKLD